MATGVPEEQVPVRMGSEPSLAAQMTWWVIAFPVLMGVAIALHNLYLLDYAHVLSGALWTGADLFLGFIVGPVMRRLDPDRRRAVVQYLVPKTLLYMPVIALTTGTAGYTMATWLGMLAPGSPDRIWIAGAIVVTFILAAMGLGVLLPNNLRIYGEFHKPQPDIPRVMRLNRQNLALSGLQGVFQVIIILIMAHLAVG